MHRISRIVAMAGVLTLTGLSVAGPATAQSPAPTATACRDAPTRPVSTGAVFNNPAAGEATAVVEQVCSLVKQAPAGARIQIAHFVISGAAGMDFTDVLLAAQARGVQVQVVLDGWQVDKPAAAKLIAALGQDTTADSWVHVCSHQSPEGNTTSCQGTKGMHNKFYLFSETGGSQDVVLQSSANVTDVNSRTYWNNALTVVGNHRLHEAYSAYFEDLVAEEQDPDYYRSVATAGPGGPVTAHFFPSADTDPVQERLEELRCKNSGTDIRIGMSEWDVSRIGIAEELARMAAAGCTVRIVHGPMDPEVAAVLTAQEGIDLRELAGSELPGRIHSKYLIVDDPAGKRSGGQLVLTGSHNYTSTSLHRNDEALLELRHQDVYEQYEKNFETMWEAAG